MDDEQTPHSHHHKLAATLPLVRCKGCVAVFKPVRNDQAFHTPACRDLYWRRARFRGAAVYEALVRWRKYRGQGKGKGAMADVASIVDTWLAADGIATVSQKRKRKDT